MRTRWDCQSPLGTVIEFIRAMRERELEGKWPECQDDPVLFQLSYFAIIIYRWCRALLR
jgi:hypothetical protein